MWCQFMYFRLVLLDKFNSISWWLRTAGSDSTSVKSLWRMDNLCSDVNSASSNPDSLMFLNRPCTMLRLTMDVEQSVVRHSTVKFDTWWQVRLPSSKSHSSPQRRHGLWWLLVMRDSNWKCFEASLFQLLVLATLMKLELFVAVTVDRSGWIWRWLRPVPIPRIRTSQTIRIVWTVDLWRSDLAMANNGTFCQQWQKKMLTAITNRCFLFFMFK